MPIKPNSLPLWATQNSSNVVAPPSELQATGWLPGQPLPAAMLNSQFQNLGAWVQYLAAAQSSGQVIDAVEPAIRLIDGGRWSYALSTTTLAWSSPFAISFAGLPDSQNQCAAGSATVPSGSVAYVNANAPFVDSGSTTSGSTTVSGLSYPDQLTAGWVVSGSGIPSGTTVKSIDTTAKSIVLSAAANATASGIRLVFTGSGPLTVQVSDVGSFAPAANTVVIARATATDCIVGVGSGQMLLQPQESKRLLAQSYLSTTRITAGADLSYGQAVYVSQGTDGRTSGSAYPCEANATNGAQRGYFAGLVHSAAAAGAQVSVVSSGTVAISGLTAGLTYYLDPANPGAITSVKPASLLSYVVPVGMAINATTLLLTPAADRQPKTLDATLSHSSIVMGGQAVPSNYAAGSNLYPYVASYNGSAFVGHIAYYWPKRPVFLTEMNLSLLGTRTGPTQATLSVGYETDRGNFGGTADGPQGILVTRTADGTFGAKSLGFVADVSDANLQLLDYRGHYFAVSFSSVPAAGLGTQARITIAY